MKSRDKERYTRERNAMVENTAKNAIYQPPFRTRAAAEWMGVSEKQLLDFARAGLIGRKVGSVWFFSQRELAEFCGVPTDDVRAGK